MLKKMISFVLAATLVVGSFSGSNLTLNAAQASDSVKVYASSQVGDDYLAVPKKMEVSADLSEQYGYVDAVTDGVSTLDVLIAEHARIFGDGFTTETKNDYLVVSDEGWVSKTFGEDGATFGFAVNSAAPHDDKLTDWGYTGYLIHQAKVQENDIVNFFFYQDSYYLDNMTVISIEKESVEAGDSIKGTVNGYCFAYDGCADETTLAEKTKAMSGISIGVLDDTTGALVKETEVTTDENGQFAIKMDKAGTYLIGVAGTSEDEPFFRSFKEVVVTDKVVEAPSKAPAKKYKITLNYKSLKLQKGQSTTAVAIEKKTAKADQIVSATANKKNIVSLSVKKGVLKIKGLKTGTVKVTVKSKKGATATININVQKNPVKVSKLESNGSKNIKLKKNGKQKLKVKVYPVTAKAKLKYTSSNKKVVSVSSSGTVKALKKGKAKITVKDANGKKTTFTVTVK